MADEGGGTKLIHGGKSPAMPDDSKAFDTAVACGKSSRRWKLDDNDTPLQGVEADGRKGPVNLFPAERVRK
jgi:hypothetical protein